MGSTFQEDLQDDPFWMLVACQLVNLTAWKTARPVFDAIRARWANPYELSQAPIGDLEDLLRPLGLFRRQSYSLRAMAECWLLRPPHTRFDVERLPGCGKYAADSWEIFQEGNLGAKASDRKLLAYLERIKKQRAQDGKSSLAT